MNVRSIPLSEAMGCLRACAKIFVLTMLTGCTIGPALVVNSHVEYNKAVEQVINEELLLNIVRRRYHEAPQFVTISSISSSINSTAGITGGANFVEGSTPTTYNAGGSLSFSDSPTITITPQQGHEISGPLTARMDYVSVAKLANAGYRFDMLLAMMVEGLTNLRGPQTGVGDSFRPGEPAYVELIDRVESLIDQGHLVAGTFRWNNPYSAVTYKPGEISIENQISVVALGGGTGRFRSFDEGKTYYFTNKKMYPAVWIDPEAREAGDGKRVIELLNLQPFPLKRIWTFSPSRVIDGPDFEGRPDKPRADIKMRMRSFYAVLNFLAYGVEVPLQDEQDGRAFTKEAYDRAVKEGRAVDLSDKFVVRWSKERPGDALVAVSYRGKWFYIDDRDHVSKRFFNVVYDLFNLEIAPSSSGSNSPVLTLPVN